MDHAVWGINSSRLWSIIELSNFEGETDMKKINILLALAALVLASLACQTIMGGGDDDDFELPDMPDIEMPTEIPGDMEIPTIPPVTTDDGNVTIGGESPFPMLADAFNVVSTPTSLTYQTKKSTDDVMKFYQDELSAMGFEEDTSMSTNFGGIVAMFFTNSEGKTIVLGGAPVGDGSISVTLAYSQ